VTTPTQQQTADMISRKPPKTSKKADVYCTTGTGSAAVLKRYLYQKPRENTWDIDGEERGTKLSEGTSKSMQRHVS
jgi:hypothetical protein